MHQLEGVPTPQLGRLEEVTVLELRSSSDRVRK
jgi:hypothetical protein